MTTENATNRGRVFTASLLPWLVAAGMFLVYLLTLNHSVSPNNAYRIAELGGWDSPQRFFAPVTFLVTYPLRWLPQGSIEMGLNLFTALCAALTLALLARSVSLLPHDRTYDQRQRELSEFSLLTIPAAWLPPLFAALVCGFQMSFWENSVNTLADTPELNMLGTDAAGQIFDLLLFAYSIRCLLEYRISLRDSWIARFAFVYGLGMANNWLMVGLFPGFLAALIWIRGLSFFNPRFLGVVTSFGLAGALLIIVHPIRVVQVHVQGFGFWQALHYILRTDKSVITSIPSDALLLLALTSALPILLIGIRWASYFGDTSQLGIFLATFAFHIVHGVLLLACIWVTFDPPFSPRQKGFGVLFLPLYYLGSLSIGYFAGYFLLIFGKKIAKARHRPHPAVRFLNSSIVGIIWLLAVTVPVFQVWKNLPQLRARQAGDAALARFSALTAQSLPKKPAVLLGDDRLQLTLLESSIGRGSGATKHLFINTSFLNQGNYYIRRLEKEYSEFKLSGTLTNTTVLPDSVDLIHFLEKMAQNHDVFYLHPSFGYYFERFYPEPHGLVYQLKRFGTGQWRLPPPSAHEVEENQIFWKKTVADELPTVAHLIDMPKHPVSSGLLAHFMESGHLTLETNRSASLLGAYYSRSLDYWGVELERSGHSPEAATAFEQALKFNPDSVAAKINVNFAQKIRTGEKIVIERPKMVQDKFGKHRGWTDLLNEDGPFADPSFSYVLGETFAAGETFSENGQQAGGGGNFRQAMQQFDWTRTVVPDFPDANLWLAKLFLFLRYNSDALAAAEHVLQRNPQDLSALFYQSVAFMELGSYDKALVPINQFLAVQNNNFSALLNRAICHLKLQQYNAAKTDYETLADLSPKSYQIDYGLLEIAYNQKNTNDLTKYCERYLTNYTQSFPTNVTPPETEEVKQVKQRLKESKNGAP